jgi:hypothetical protein
VQQREIGERAADIEADAKHAKSAPGRLLLAD